MWYQPAIYPGCSTKGGFMRHRRWLTPLVLLGAFAMIAAACSNSRSVAWGSTSGSAAVDCNAAPGCVTVAAGAPIQSGTLLSVSGDNAVFCFQAEDGIRDYKVTGVQTCALPI